MEENKYLSAAIFAAKEAGSMLMGQLESASSKDDLSNPSVKQDKDSELLILKILKEKFPNHGFLGEEFGEKNPIAEYKWIIDPIDGTNNYTGGRDSFSVSIGLENNKEIVLGVVYLPKRDELFYATKGNGAFLNEKQIKVSDRESNLESIVTYSTYPGEEEKTKILNDKILASFPKVKCFGFSDKKNLDETFGRGSMAAEFCYLACGRIDGLIRLKQKPWDVAAGSIIAKEAGAYMNNLEGKECSVYEGDYVAANPKLLDNIDKVIFD
ncbi:inositol monophosphatase [Candidatus Pacearchaeota archaeon]|nr:inositol monophosphatase [Candidatus Pacearchaeota archaeon]